VHNGSKYILLVIDVSVRLNE